MKKAHKYIIEIEKTVIVLFGAGSTRGRELRSRAAVWLIGMSDPYERVKGGRLAFKGGILASRSKSIDKKGKKKKKNKGKDNDNNPNPNPNPEEQELEQEQEQEQEETPLLEDEGEGSEYTIDAAKRMKYEQLFPVEAKKFGYQPKTNFKSVEDALDDRVKKKADRYCK